MVEIRKIQLKNLQDFTLSEEYRQFEHVPISIKRAASYVQNPKSNLDDFVLYLGFVNKQLVAYRSLYRDELYINNQTFSFGWNSGSWVHPDFRRQGISKQLLQEVHKDWENRTLFTNFAPNSGKLYVGTGNYELLHQLNGFRYYFKSPIAEILPKKLPFLKTFSFVWKGLDTLFNTLFFKKKEFPKITKHYSITDFKDLEEYKCIESFPSLFQKSQADFEWWKQYPWIESGEREPENSKKYNFSSWTKNYSKKVITFTENNEIKGILIVSIRDQKMKIPYYFGKNIPKNEIEMAIHELVNVHQINMLTCYSSEVNKAFEKYRLKKKFTQQFYIHKQFKTELGRLKNITMYNGDGDGIFT